VPTGMPNHPCVRVYILPPNYLAAFDRTAILNITTPAQLAQMEAVYGFTTNLQRYAQKNISRHTTETTCPFLDCGIGRAGPEVASLGGATALQLVSLPAIQAVSLSATETTTRTLDVFLTPEELAAFGEDNVVVQLRALGYATYSGNETPRYNFVEDLGGVIQLIPLDMLVDGQEVAFQTNVSNPLLMGVNGVERTIGLRIDTLAPPHVGRVAIDIDTTPQTYQPGETKVVQGTVRFTSDPVYYCSIKRSLGGTGSNADPWPCSTIEQLEDALDRVCADGGGELHVLDVKDPLVFTVGPNCEVSPLPGNFPNTGAALPLPIVLPLLLLVLVASLAVTFVVRRKKALSRLS
ncbi:MAG TPA: hypothetical protein VL334_15360, partial [Anaerolineae bacterium]|nr:hypothetical protein [Anaerolineae bacterium]